MSYEPLTKKITDEQGRGFVVCRYYDTDMCRKIHTPNNCIKCPMLQMMLIQLNAFEEIMMEGDDNNG